MTSPLIDLSYIRDISGNEPAYIHDIVGIFIDTMSNGLEKLEQLVYSNADDESIQKQAHFLKSSAGIVKVRDNYDHLVKIDAIMKLSIREHIIPDYEEVRTRLEYIIANFNEALPALNEEKEKNKPA